MMLEQPNLNYLDVLAGDDQAFRDRFIGILKSEFPVERSEYEEALNKGNDALAADLVHKIKHKISILGLEKRYEMAADYEEALRLGSRDKSLEFQETLDLMENFLAQQGQ